MQMSGVIAESAFAGLMYPIQRGRVDSAQWGTHFRRTGSIKNDCVFRGSPMHLFCRKQRSGMAVPARRAWAKAIVCLLIVAGLAFHAVQAGPSFAQTGTAEVDAVKLNHQHSHNVTFSGSSAVPHCPSTAPCVFLSVQRTFIFRAPEPGGWIAGPPRYHRSKIAYRQFRPPRLPAHA